MARGIAAFVFVGSLILSMSILGGVGYYVSLGTGVDVDASSSNADVEAAAGQVGNITFGEGRSNSILQGPLAVVTPVVGILQTFTAVLGNTSGILQLLYGLPPVAADAIELLFRIAMLVTLVYLIRSGSPV
jgi:hypothetical protein